MNMSISEIPQPLVYTMTSIGTILVVLIFKFNSTPPTNSQQRHMQGPRSLHHDYDYCYLQLYIT